MDVIVVFERLEELADIRPLSIVERRILFRHMPELAGDNRPAICGQPF